MFELGCIGSGRKRGYRCSSSSSSFCRLASQNMCFVSSFAMSARNKAISAALVALAVVLSEESAASAAAGAAVDAVTSGHGSESGGQPTQKALAAGLRTAASGSGRAEPKIRTDLEARIRKNRLQVQVDSLES